MDAETVEKPKIYVFDAGALSGAVGLCVAMAEDGSVLQGHYCAHESQAPSDLGMVPGIRSHRHDAYRKHYPDGYELVYVPEAEFGTNPGFIAANLKFVSRFDTGDACGITEAMQDARKHMTHFGGPEGFTQ